ncbi:MAG: YfiM family protein [Candidatus Kapabacteria bacterium]|nr:YfiM family protein [Candidatus Kapabacteria bacterium]
MFKLIIPIFLAPLFCVSLVTAQIIDFNNNDLISKFSMINDISFLNSTNDTVINSSSQSINNTNLTNDNTLYVNFNNFTYADKHRYTIDGSQPLEFTKIKPIPAILFGAGYTGIFVLQHIGQMKTIWKETGKFHFQEDGYYALYSDKAGHFFGTYLSSYVLSETMMTIGFSWDAASIWGAVLGLAYTTYVEINDGFAVNWGFSMSDFYADIAGAGFFLAQHYIPFLQNFTPKFMYMPSPWTGNNYRIPSEMFIDDYSSHTLWLSVNVYNLLPDNLKKYWIPWLEISFGYAVRNLCDPINYKCPPESEKFSDLVYGNPKFIIALDYDLVKMLPDGGNFWNWLKQSLNHFKLPSPAIEFGSTTKFYLIYPIPIKIGNVRF